MLNQHISTYISNKIKRQELMIKQLTPVKDNHLDLQPTLIPNLKISKNKIKEK